MNMMNLSTLTLLGFGLALPAAGQADEQWARHEIASGFMCQTAVAADFTSDGLPDVIVDAHGETHLYVAPGWEKVVIDGKWPIRPGERNTIHSEVMDVDNDGDPDYIGAVYSPGPVFWLERPADPMRDWWPLRIIDSDVNGTHGLIKGDVDGDGNLSILSATAHSPRIRTPTRLCGGACLRTPARLSSGSATFSRTRTRPA